MTTIETKKRKRTSSVTKLKNMFSFYAIILFFYSAGVLSSTHSKFALTVCIASVLYVATEIFPKTTEEDK